MQVADEDMTSAALLRRYIMQHQKLADNLLPPLASDILDSHGLHCNACSGMCRLRYDILSLPTSLLEFSASVLQNYISSPEISPETRAGGLKLLQDICLSKEVLPSQYWLKDVQKGSRLSRGGEATVYQGSYQGQTVVIREIHLPSNDTTTAKGLVMRETIAHWQLRHPNIVSLIGVFTDFASDETIPSMVLEYAKHASVREFLMTSQEGGPFVKIVIGMIDGLHYLHTRNPPVIHGDLHDRNVLVSADGSALLCDFGFSRIRHEITRTHTTLRQGGRLRFTAPELLFASDDVSKINEASDIYSLAMTIYTLATDKLPLYEHPNDYAAARAIEEGKRPSQPKDHLRPSWQHFNDMWSELTSMWEHNPHRRPPIAAIRRSVHRRFASIGSNESIPPRRSTGLQLWRQQGYAQHLSTVTLESDDQSPGDDSSHHEQSSSFQTRSNIYGSDHLPSDPRVVSDTPAPHQHSHLQFGQSLQSPALLPSHHHRTNDQPVLHDVITVQEQPSSILPRSATPTSPHGLMGARSYETLKQARNIRPLPDAPTPLSTSFNRTGALLDFDCASVEAPDSLPLASVHLNTLSLTDHQNKREQPLQQPPIPRGPPIRRNNDKSTTSSSVSLKLHREVTGPRTRPDTGERLLMPESSLVESYPLSVAQNRQGTDRSTGPPGAGSHPDPGSLIRPNNEPLYEHVDRFFPKVNLDKPDIDESTPPSVDSSHSPHILPPTGPYTVGTILAPTAVEAAISPRDTSHRKSIRVIADERSQRIKHLLKGAFGGKTSEGKNVGRRVTRLWGNKVEELPRAASSGPVVTPAQEVNAPDTTAIAHTTPIPERSMITFRWVRGGLIGRGSHGRVYHALNVNTGEIMAVKRVELPKTHTDNNDRRQTTAVEALKSENAILSTLDHPHIVQYLGFEETLEFLSIFLEYIPGGSIGGCMRKYGKFSEDIIKSFTKQVVDGLSYLHEVGIIHRDLTRDHILLDPSGVCKIIGFSNSCYTSTKDIYGDASKAFMPGSIYRVAPDILTSIGGEYSSKIDVWVMGCLVLEMWAGRGLWSTENQLSLTSNLSFGKPAPPVVPEDVHLGILAEDFRAKCLTFDPALRPSAAELVTHPYLVVPSNWVFPGFPRQEGEEPSVSDTGSWSSSSS